VVPCWSLGVGVILVVVVMAFCLVGIPYECSVDVWCSHTYMLFLFFLVSLGAAPRWLIVIVSYFMLHFDSSCETNSCTVTGVGMFLKNFFACFLLLFTSSNFDIMPSLIIPLSFLFFFPSLQILRFIAPCHI